MESTKSMSDSQPTRAFYLPATIDSTRVPGRLERALTRRSSHLQPRGASSSPVREFYLPATAVSSTVPGNVQRWVTSLLRNRDERIEVPVAKQQLREFYLPAMARLAKRPR